MAAQEYDAGKLSQSDIDSFVEKAAAWAASLPAEQKTVADLLVEQARGLTPGRVAFAVATEDLRRVVFRALASLPDALVDAPQAWPKVGPVWQRANPAKVLEEFEIVITATRTV